MNFKDVSRTIETYLGYGVYDLGDGVYAIFDGVGVKIYTAKYQNYFYFEPDLFWALYDFYTKVTGTTAPKPLVHE